MSKRIRFGDFVESEIRYFLQACNFSEDEKSFFLLRTRHKSIVEICFEMNISESKAGSLSKAVSKKIIKVL